MTLRSSALAAETAEVWLVLLTIDQADLSEPIRVVNNHVDITSGGDLYSGFPFNVQLPSSAEDGPPSGRLVIDNVSLDITQAVRLMTTPATVEIKVVAASDPDTVEATWPDFILSNVKWNTMQVMGDLTLENFVNEPYPAHSFTPGFFPGIF